MRNDLMARYVIGEPVYENEFIVYPGEDRRMSRLVSIVVPDQSLKADRARFERAWSSINEAKSLSPLRFVEIEDLIGPTETDDNFYIVEKRPSKTLRQYLAEQDMVAYEPAVAIADQILQGIATLHSAGYAHNALTDQCIYVAEDYAGLSVRIGNLHLISRIGEHIVPPYVPEFGAPEIYASGSFHASAALDIYAAGMLAYKLFLPRRAYEDVFHSVMVWEGEHQREQSWKNIHLDPSNIFPRLDMLVNGLSSDLAGLIERMLSRDPAGRPRDGAEALQEFRRATISRSGPRPQMEDWQKPARNDERKKPARWSARTIALVAALVVVTAGVGVVTVPKILGPDPQLVASVEAWKTEAENRRNRAVAAKAPERPTGDEARLAFEAGSQAQAAGGGAVEKRDYELALQQYKDAAGRFGASLVDIARDDAAKARKAAADAGGERAPAFAEADKGIATAATAAGAGELRAAIEGFGGSKAAFDTLARTLTAMTAARRDASSKHNAAERMGAADLADFPKASAALADGEARAKEWAIGPAIERFGDAGRMFDAMIAEIRGSQDAAGALKQKVAALAAAITSRGGGDEPDFSALLPMIAAADAQLTAEAFKRAVAAYQPLVAGLEAIASRGFCPVAPGMTFERVTAGSYALDNMRLMTSQLSELGSMLGAANGAIRVDKAFCLESRLVTRADIGAYYAATGDSANAAAYASSPELPADDVPLATAQAYAAWLSSRLNAALHVPSAHEWMAGASKAPAAAAPDSGDIVLQWSTTSCEAGGNIAFMAQAGSTFVVCSDASAGGQFRLAAEMR